MINNLLRSIIFLIHFIVNIYRECLVKFGDAQGKEVWDAINSVFDVLPLAAVIDDKVNEAKRKKNHYVLDFNFII